MTPASAAILAQAEHHLAQRHLPDALAAFNRAESLGAPPGPCSAGRWQAHMLLGNFEQAWKQSDAIRHRNLPDPHRFWHGEDLRGATVILRCLHGFGDAIQMLRFAPRLRAQATHLILEVPPSLHPLASLFPGPDEVITWGPNAPAHPPAFDVQIECMELPYLLRLQPEDLPGPTNYLHLSEALLAATAQSMGPRQLPRIGLVWAAGDWNPNRNLPLATLTPLLNHPRIDLWSLQGGPTRTSLPHFPDATARCGDGILPLAAVIANLDLVVTVDTLAAHLAGALGKPAWLLLQHAADWRWMTHRADSPWYPTMRLFRQPSPGDWPAVIQSACHALQEVHP